MYIEDIESALIQAEADAARINSFEPFPLPDEPDDEDDD